MVQNEFFRMFRCFVNSQCVTGSVHIYYTGFCELSFRWFLLSATHLAQCFSCVKMTVWWTQMTRNVSRVF